MKLEDRLGAPARTSAAAAAAAASSHPSTMHCSTRTHSSHARSHCNTVHSAQESAGLPVRVPLCKQSGRINIAATAELARECRETLAGFSTPPESLSAPDTFACRHDVHLTAALRAPHAATPARSMQHEAPVSTKTRENGGQATQRQTTRRINPHRRWFRVIGSAGRALRPACLATARPRPAFGANPPARAVRLARVPKSGCAWARRADPAQDAARRGPPASVAMFGCFSHRPEAPTCHPQRGRRPALAAESLWRRS